MKYLLLFTTFIALTTGACVDDTPGDGELICVSPPDDYTVFCDDTDVLAQVIEDTWKCGSCITVTCGAESIGQCVSNDLPRCQQSCKPPLEDSGRDNNPRCFPGPCDD